MAAAGGYAAWMVALVSLVAGLLILWITVPLAMRFPGQTPVGYFQFLLGPVLGKVAAAGLLLYLALGIPLDLRVATDNTIAIFFVHTPAWAVLLLLVYAGSYLAVLGPAKMARLAPFFLVVVSLVVATLVLLGSPYFHPGYLSPLEGPGGVSWGSPYLWAAASLHHCLLLYLFLLPSLRQQGRALRTGLLAVLFGSIPVTASLIVPLMTFGVPMMQHLAQPSILYFSILTWHQLPVSQLSYVLFMLWQFNMLFTFGLGMYALALGTGQLLGLADYRVLVPLFAILGLVSAHFLRSVSVLFLLYRWWAPGIFVFAGLLFPLLWFLYLRQRRRLALQKALLGVGP